MANNIHCNIWILLCLGNHFPHNKSKIIIILMAKIDQHLHWGDHSVKAPIRPLSVWDGDSNWLKWVLLVSVSAYFHQRSKFSLCIVILGVPYWKFYIIPLYHVKLILWWLYSFQKVQFSPHRVYLLTLLQVVFSYGFIVNL